MCRLERNFFPHGKPISRDLCPHDSTIVHSVILSSRRTAENARDSRKPVNMATQVNRLNDGVDIIDEPPRDAKRALLLLAAVIFLSFITLFFGLGQLPFVGPDEPRYAEVAREMFVTGDYVSPRLAGCLWFEKPALTYWMAAAAYHLFGVGEFAARLPAAMLALLTALFVYYSVSRTVSARSGLIAAVVLVTSGIFLGFARAISTDMPLAATMSFALLAGYLFTQTSGRARVIYWTLCWASMGLAMLAKGLVGIMLVVAILGIYLLLMRQWSLIRWNHLAVGIVVFFTIIAMWYLPVTIVNGWEFINEFFVEHHFQRYLTNRYSHPQPVYFYLLISLAGVVPWTFFLIPAIARIRRLSPRSDSRDALVAFAWIWFAVPVAFFSFSTSKLPGYILPVFPALAIIIGSEIEKFLSTERANLHKIAAWLTGLTLTSIGAAAVIFAGREGISPTGWRVALLWLPAVLALATMAMLLAHRQKAFIAGTAAVVACTVIVIVALGFPVLGERISRKKLSVEAATALRPDEKIAFFMIKEFAPVFYAQGRVVCGVGGNHILNATAESQLIEAMQGETSLVIFTTEEWKKRLEASNIFDLEPIGSQGKIVAVRIVFKQSATSSQAKTADR